MLGVPTRLLLALPLLLPAGSRGEVLEPVRVQDLDGRVHLLGAGSSAPICALVFLGVGCPVSNAAIPELNRLAAEAAERSSGEPCTVLAVLSDGHATRAEAQELAEDFELAVPLLFDAGGELARRLRPTHVPEAFVLANDGNVLYRGRIDSRFASPGEPDRGPTRRFLADALAALARGRAIEEPRTEPVGCLFEAWLTDVEGIAAETITYARDVAPILYTSCLPCHREGDVAPFPLTTHADAARRARMIASVTADRRMPPWHAEPGFGRFRGERRLSEREIAVLAAWAEADAPAGDPADLPPPPDFAVGWRSGEPDLVLELPAYEVPAEAEDEYRCFVLPTDLGEDVFVVAAEFRPGEPTVVHHAIHYVDESGEARALDAAAPGPGYARFGGPGFRPSGVLGGWAPGAEPRRAPRGTGSFLPAGADVVVQVHYHPSGRAETDASRLGLYITREKDLKRLRTAAVRCRDFTIPAGAARHVLEAELETEEDALVLGVTPHMHLLGREMELVAETPAGEVLPMIRVPDWDFAWQEQYQYAAPVRLPRGTRLRLRAVYDNSAANPANPNHPPRDVREGEETTDEMCYCFLSYVRV